jgi:hypothetical protein
MFKPMRPKRLLSSGMCNIEHLGQVCQEHQEGLADRLDPSDLEGQGVQVGLV